MPQFTINIFGDRTGPGQRSWDLPAWGHPISQCVLPLFIHADGRLKPIGTAFWIGTGVQFIGTAMHNIAEAFRFEPSLERPHALGQLPSSATMKYASLSVLHQDNVQNADGTLSLISLRSVNAAPPGDVAFGYPEFGNKRATLSLPLSFDPPRIGETVWSVGYTEFEPRDGIPTEALLDGSFSWAKDYHHRLVVTEGRVERIFTQRFSNGYLEGPCFSFDNEIAHGQSGGPVISASGTVVGINSCDATIRFGRPTTLSSMLYPLLLTNISFGGTFGGGNLTINLKSSRPLIDLVMAGIVSSDGSEEHVAMHRGEEHEGLAIGPRIHLDDREFVHDDFQGFRDQRGATSLAGEFYGFRRTNNASPTDPSREE